jgi:hypothetical protein
MTLLPLLFAVVLTGCSLFAGGGATTRAGGTSPTTKLGMELGGTGSHHFGLAGSAMLRSTGSEIDGVFAVSGLVDSDEKIDERGRLGLRGRLGVQLALEGEVPYPMGVVAAISLRARYLMVELEYARQRGDHDVSLTVGFDPVMWYVAQHHGE